MELMKKIRKGTRSKAVKGLAGIVAFATAYSLIMPAITIDQETAEEEPGMVLNENENAEEALAEYEAPEEVVEEAPQEEPAAEEAPAEEAKEETPAEEPAVEEKKEEAPAEEAKPAEETKQEETKPAEEPKQEEAEIVLEATAGKLEYEAKEDYKVTIEYTKDAGFIEGTELEIRETLKEDEYANSLVKVQKEFEEDGEIVQARFFETLFKAGEEEYKTAEGKVIVTYEPEKMEIEEGQEVTVLVTDREGKYQEIDEKKLSAKTNEKKVKEIKFETEDLESFTILVLEKEAEEEITETPSEEPAEETQETETAMPAASFSKTADDVIVTVDAPEGAFPEGTQMEIELVDETPYMDAINSTISDDETVKTAQAVDIRFIYNGEEIEPQKEIKVNLISSVIKQTEDPKLIHIDNEGSASIVDATQDTKTYSEEINNPSKTETVESLTFTSDAFSVYVIVGTETLTTQVITAEGDTYTIEVTCGPEAKIPSGAELIAREIEQGSEEFFKYYNNTIRELGFAPLRVIDEHSLQVEFVSVNEILPEVPQARYFDISIVSDGNVVEPEAPVEVKITYNSELQVNNNNEIKSIHFVDEDEVEINSASTQVKGNRTEISFTQEGFSATGTIEVSTDGNTTFPGEGNNTAEFVPLRAASGENNGPKTTKTVRDNGNGTHTIRLDILGEVEQQTDITKANVIVVLDISGSMNNSVGNSTRWAQAKAAVNNVASTLLGKNNPDGISGNDDDDIIEMALVTFSTNATTRVQSATSASTISSALNNTTPTGGTNWEAAIQQSAGVTFDNDGDPTYVIFISDGNPTYRNSWGGYNAYLPRSDNATWAQNWPGGSYYNYMRSDNYFYNSDGVYGLGGDSQFSGNQYVPNYSPTSMQRCYDQAKDDAAAVITSGRQFYGIGVYGNAAWVNNLVNDSGAPSGHYYNAADASALAQALEDIADAITKNLGFTNVSTSDGVTELSSISAKVVDGHATGFRYYKNGTTWADAPEATPTADGITWDLSSENPLADQTTYSIEFDIWPSQEAYDTVANLNNGLVAYADLPQTVRDQINDNGDGTYSLKTNTSLTTTYTKNGVTDTDEWDKGNSAMSLDVRTFKVRKLWDNQLDGRPTTSVELIVTKDGANYLDGDHSIKLTADADGNMISDDIFISCGFITHETGGYDVKEHGHDYSIIETEEYAYYWDLTAPTYRPMVIDETPHMLVKTDSPTGTDGQDYYVIDGGTYQVRDTETILEATNERRSWVNLSKTVTDNSVDVADPDAFFEYTITVNNANAAKGTASDTGSDYYVWFSVDSDPSAAFAPVAAADLEYSSAVTPEDGTNGYFYVASGAEFTISIKKDWNIRFINLPAGSDYNFNETGMPNGFELDSITPNVSAGSGATPATVNGSVADGDIDKANTDYSVVYANKWATAPYVYIQKTDNEYANSLSGAEFHMNKMTTSWTNVADYTLNQTTEVTVGGETKTYDNLAPLGPVGVNRYQLIETECPDGYIKAIDGFEFEVEKQNGAINVKLSDGTTANLVKGTKTVDGKTYDVYIIQLPNTPGQALPNTGGSGTLPYTLGGIALIMASALMYGFRMRRRERRLN